MRHDGVELARFIPDENVLNRKGKTCEGADQNVQVYINGVVRKKRQNWDGTV